MGILDKLMSKDMGLTQSEREDLAATASKLKEELNAKYNAQTAKVKAKDGVDGKNGKDGKDGRDGRDGRNGKDGTNGLRGPQGDPGRNGVDGADGVSVTDAHIDFDGSLIIDLSTGRAINVGEVVSQDIAEKIKVIQTMSTNGAVGIKDEGSSISTGVKNINFVGAAVTATNSGDDVTVNVSSGTGTVTSVDVSGGTTGLTTSGGPIITTGTITLGGTLAVASGGTGTATPSLVAGTNITSITGSWPNQTINASGGSGTVTSVAASAGTGISITGSPITTSGTLNITNTAPDQVVALTSGTGISATGTYPNFTIANTAPDQTVALTQGGTTTITGTYPNFTISSADQFQGTVTSVTGTSPVASSGGTTPAISLASGYGDTLNPYASKTANFVLAAPNGSAGVPTFRAIVASDIPTLNQSTTGNAATVTTNANLAGDVTSVGNTTSIAAGVIVNADINASAGIVDTKLATISTALKVSNSATTATNANTASAIVARDASGNFSAGTITAALTGNASTATTLATGRTIAITGDLAYTSGSFNGSADVTGTGTLATVNSNVGSFTNASITVNAKGLITAASSGSGGGITRGTSVSASGTSVSFTSLPSTIKRISLLFSGVSTNGSSAFLVQLGTGGTATTSGYVCASGRVFFSTNVQTSTAGFILNYDNAAYAVQGSLSFENISGNTWVASGTVSSTASTPLAILMGGTVTLSGVLDMIRLTTVNGTDSYDAGTLNILYQ